jgi:hypothetical protein
MKKGSPWEPFLYLINSHMNVSLVYGKHLGDEYVH